jgi:hypothetical protein
VKPRLGLLLSFLLLVLSTVGCVTHAPDISGRWKPVNHFSEAPQSIPLYQSYVFYPSPMDRTLKSMLTRWAKDSKRTLSYLHSSDFTLYQDVADIRTTDLGAAVSRLNSAYSAEGVTITSDERQIVVRPTSVEGVASGDVDSP